MPVRFNTGGGVAAGKDTATEKDVRYLKTFHSGKGVKAKVGQILDCAVKRIIPSTRKQTIPAGSYIADEITVDGDEALVSQNIRAGISIFGVEGKWSVVDTATANLDPEKMLEGCMGFCEGKEVNGKMKTLTDSSFSPADASAFNDCRIVGAAQNSWVGAFDYSLAGYINGRIRIHIANLLAGNIRSGVKVGGVGGWLTGTFTSDATAAEGDILEGKTAGVKGSMIRGNIPVQGTWNASCGTNESVRIPRGYHNGLGQVANSQATRGGQTVTPTTSQQTVSCSGKLMTGDVVVNPIPSNYVNVSSNPAFFSGGTYGKLADLGAYYYEQHGSEGDTYTAIGAGEISGGYVSVRASSGNWERMIIFRRCIPTRIKRIVAVVNVGGSVYKRTYMMIVKDRVYNSNSMAEMDGLNADQTLTVTMPDNPDPNAKYALVFRCGLNKAATSTFRIKSIIGYEN